MRIRIFTAIVGLLLLSAALGACAGGAASIATGTPAGGGGQAATAAPAGTTAATANGKVDCTKIKAAAAQLLNLQFLAQLKTPDNVEAVRSKQIGNVDIDAFLAALHDLHELDGSTSALGDPKPAIDYYEQAGNAAKTLFATNPVTQAAIDTYNQKVGTVGDFLSRQIAISAAIDDAHC